MQIIESPVQSITACFVNAGIITHMLSFVSLLPLAHRPS
jgi:hypothetical protein